MTKEYWKKRTEWYSEMAEHIKSQRENADQKERQRLSKELERVYNEIGFIKENHLA